MSLAATAVHPRTPAELDGQIARETTEFQRLLITQVDSYVRTLVLGESTPADVNKIGGRVGKLLARFLPIGGQADLGLSDKQWEKLSNMSPAEIGQLLSTVL